MPKEKRNPQSVAGHWLLPILTISAFLLFAACTGPLEQKPAAAPTQSEPSSAPQQVAGAASPFSPDQTVLQLQPLVSGLDKPVFITNAGDSSGRIFVVEKAGIVRVVEEGRLDDAPFLDIRDRVLSSGNEQGLLGLAFAPDYADNGFFYVNYTDGSGNTIVSRFQVTADNPHRADATTEWVVIQIDQPARNHNGGMLTFGPDGYLYIGTGDGGAAADRFGNGQNPDTLLGKMLRLDVTSDLNAAYKIPANNPWIENDWNGVAVRDEIWAFGLRNPWRFSFDRQTGDLWIADVGQNVYEEINFIPASSESGLNFGWPILEGAHCFRDPSGCDSQGLVLPVLEYSHEGHCSVTGGYVYRGALFPQLGGVYFYGDYCSGTIWAATADGTGGVSSNPVLDSSIALSSFGEDEAGELYAADMAKGVVYQLVVAQE